MTQSKKLTRAMAIRQKCLDCADSPKEVRLCTSLSCELYPYRMGRGHWPAIEVNGELRPSLPAPKKAPRVDVHQPGALIHIEGPATHRRVRPVTMNGK